MQWATSHNNLSASRTHSCGATTQCQAILGPAQSAAPIVALAKTNTAADKCRCWLAMHAWDCAASVICSAVNHPAKKSCSSHTAGAGTGFKG